MASPSPNTQMRFVSALEASIDYVFKDKGLALQALTHSSYGDGRRTTRDNERLEFLGDRVLGLMTAERLFDLVDGNEGDLARRLNALVRKEACANVSRQIGLGDFLLISPSEERQGGREKTSILGDACEALLGALYLDGGLPVALAFYNRYWRTQIEAVTKTSQKDPKTELQERASAAKKGAPVYSVKERSGPDHRPLFVIEVSVEGVGAAQGTGKSKKDAERYAAKHLLDSWSTATS